MKDITLDASPEEFEEQLTKAVEIVLRAYNNLEEVRVFDKKSPSSLHELFDEALPHEATPSQELWQTVEQDIVGNATFSAGPNFFSYVLSPGNQMGLAAELVSSFLNQNASKWHLGPAAAEIEKIALKWVAQFIGYPQDAGGIFVSGGSMANLTCLTVARNQMSDQNLNFEGLYQSAPMMVYMTDQAHYCVDKAMAILGLGRNNIRRIPTDQHLRLRIDLLEQAIKEDLENGLRPFCVIGSAGTVNTGAIDPLEEIAQLCAAYNLWFHVDAAYGGPAAATANLKQQFKGMEIADSLALDPHKWLYVPIEVGCSLFKNPNHQKDTFSLVPEYLKVDKTADLGRTDFMEYGPQLTRSFRAMKVWMTFKAYGANKLSANIQHDIDKVEYLRSLLEKRSDFEVLAPAPLSILCFRLNPAQTNMSPQELDDLNTRLLHSLEQDGRVFITGTRINEATALRVCIVNHRTQMRHIDRLLSIVVDAAEQLLQTS